MRLPAAAGALFPLAGEEKKSNVEAECHCLHSLALARLARVNGCNERSSCDRRQYRVQVRGGVLRQLITHPLLATVSTTRPGSTRCPPRLQVARGRPLVWVVGVGGAGAGASVI
jgi:hypothetical protein